MNAVNERLAQHVWKHSDDLFIFLREPGLDATNWRAELASRFGVILRKVWGDSRTWAGARSQSLLMSVCPMSEEAGPAKAVGEVGVFVARPPSITYPLAS
jgi:hypothetical protein